MKKKILAFIFCLFVLPFVSFFSGCDATKDQNIKVRVNENYIQWSYDGNTWTNLITVDEMKDAVGDEFKGDTGAQGVSISRITKTATTGNVDTYTIYFSNNTSSTFEITNGEDGSKGDKGDNGDNGSTWLTGTAAPSSDIGANGDLYLNTTTSDVYKKSADTWTLLCNIKGSTGTKGDNGNKGDTGNNGSTWLTGTAAPSNDIGANEDLYLNTTTSDVYKKSADTWTLLCNIKGSTGTKGDDATYATYTVTLNYGAHATWFTSSTTSTISIKSTEWVTGLPDVKSDYDGYFYGWYVQGTDKKVSNYDFIGGSVTLEAKFLEPGLYQDGVLVKTWSELDTEYDSAIGGNALYPNDDGNESYFKYLSGDFVIDPGYKYITARTFKNCTELTSITLPNTIISINENAFENCTRLTSIKIPASITTIDSCAFFNCTSIKSISIDSNNANYRTDGRAILSKDSSTLIQYVALSSGETYTISTSITTITSNAFATSSTNLKTITIPSGMTTISSGAFANSSCSSIILPETITSIGRNAFLYNDNLTSIFIPASVTTIDPYAFQFCDSLTEIRFADSTTWYYTSNSDYTEGTKVTDYTATSLATSLTTTQKSFYWYKVEE